MVLVVNGNSYAYELEKLTCSFFPEEHVTVLIDGLLKDGTKPSSISLDTAAKVEVKEDKDFTVIKASFLNNGKTICELEEREKLIETSLADNPMSKELHCAQLLYKVLCKVTGLDLGWGLLTGIRPSKLLIRLMEEKGTEEGIEYFKDCFLVSDKKTELALSVSKAENEIINTSKPDSFSLYVSIPFCPSRCSYCSFVSSSMNNPTAKKIIEPYFDNLIKEIKHTAKIAKKCNIKMRSAYIGGGTPSTLSDKQIDTLLKTINESFDSTELLEFTFEAGRPDTITKEKLQAIKDNGVDRISINPQTMVDAILHSVGRSHSSKDVIDVFNIARDVGFNNINMDLIAGLPGDNFNGFKYSLDELLKLDPESITVHALAYKRSSDLIYEDGLFSATRDTAQMIDFANDSLFANGYIPYYMYRQAKSVGNLENVGWCKPGYESKYNIFMMEECHTILACGAGAVTKLKDPYGTNIERVFNYKYPFEYNDRFDELIDRKKAVLDFYGSTSLSKSN